MRNRKALLIGINYKGTSSQLGGCINDAKCMRHLLRTKFGFQDPNIVMLTEENPDTRFHPTRMNILTVSYDAKQASLHPESDWYRFDAASCILVVI